MNDNYLAALRYLSMPIRSFWKWDDGGAVVVWRSGGTITFREELAAVLRRLAPQGLPSIDAVLLLIAATRSGWITDSKELREVAASQLPGIDSPGATPPFSALTCSALNHVQVLSSKWYESVEAKGEFSAFVFESTPRVVSAEVAAVVCDVLDKRLNDLVPTLTKLQGGRAQTTGSLLIVLEELAKGLDGISEQTLALRYQTGLDEEIGPVPLELPPVSITAGSVRLLLKQLEVEQEFAGFCRLARHLAAVVEIPRSISASGELPLGGVSDLTQRGSWDRLLISELANDDLMLATRIAMNEALYLQREIPPASPPGQRQVLIDAGLRMWGVPRLFAAAVALSLASARGHQASLSCWQSHRGDLVPVELGSREGLIAHLSALDTRAQPGEAFVKLLQTEGSTEGTSDLLLITTDAVLDDPEFREQLAESSGVSFFIMTVNREGGFALWAYQPKGRKCLTTLRLDLKDLFPLESISAKTLIDESVSPDKPAILLVNPFPLRLAYKIDLAAGQQTVWSLRRPDDDLPRDSSTEAPQNTVNPAESSVESSVEGHPPVLEYWVYVLTPDGRLLVYDDPSRGARQLAVNVPFGKCLCAWRGDLPHLSFALIQPASDAPPILLRIKLSKSVTKKAVRCNQLRSRQASTSTVWSKLLGATVHQSVVFLIFPDQIEAFDISTGVSLCLDGCSLDESQRYQRFFWIKPWGSPLFRWCALSLTKNSLDFQEIPETRSPRDESRIIGMFECRGIEGPFTIRDDGWIENLSNQAQTELIPCFQSRIRLCEIDEDGHRVLFEYLSSDPQQPERNFGIAYPLTSGVTNLGDVKTLIEHDVASVNQGPELLTNLRAVALMNNRLYLIDTNRLGWAFSLKSDSELILTTHTYFTGLKTFKYQRDIKVFEVTESFRVIRWPDGSRIWLDSVGILHFKSFDDRCPEASLILAKDGISGWSSTGQYFGDPYFQNIGLPTMTAREVMKTILIPFISHLK
jgi:hypothetical protein